MGVWTEVEDEIVSKYNFISQNSTTVTYQILIHHILLPENV